jgi:O-methyltransferase
MSINVLLFGAGDAGERLYQILDSKYKVLCFADNDPLKNGTMLCGKLVISPEEICEYEYDLIIISNVHGETVKNQLINQLKVPESKIRDYYNQDLNDARTALLKMAAKEIYDANVNGNVAELGVFKGDFAVRINELFPDRILYLFDTFEGFNSTDVEIDLNNGLSSCQKGNYCYTDIDTILSRMPFANKCIIKKGYFPESAACVEDSFVFVSLDADLYQPTIEGLRYFFPRMTKGGYMFVHDYNNARFQGVKKAVREFCARRSVQYFPLQDISGSVVITK